MNKNIICFGELLWDLLPGGDILGGAPLNVAVRLQALGNRCSFVSGVGRDSLGEKALKQAALAGLDVANIQVLGDPTGTVAVSIDPLGKASYEIFTDAAFDCIKYTDTVKQCASSADCVCFGSLAQRSEPSRQTLHALLDDASAALAFCDINLRDDCYTPDTVAMSLERADVLKLNNEEAPVIAKMLEITAQNLPDIMEAMLGETKAHTCVVTLGAHGACALSESGDWAYDPGYQVVVSDTVGSGDAFCAGFLHRYLEQASLFEAISFGNILGAIVATQTGATQPISAEEIDRFAQNPRKREYDEDLVHERPSGFRQCLGY